MLTKDAFFHKSQYLLERLGKPNRLGIISDKQTSKQSAQNPGDSRDTPEWSEACGARGKLTPKTGGRGVVVRIRD